ncbi:DUF5776 domain-containing protein [Viridibacillus arvi]|uniref:DUF5776 domain-containing protein n=1 Tax=Viridibacillus arvi TaxID=263475 RepID=UPI00187B696F|nr:DUF5776 domain-containing protein [Viridibacillus sp. JNUCC-6]QOV10951.1 N-acetylmuramoyl-L-alanine amidase [Viridibacillus sp. JNUCC-6]
MTYKIENQTIAGLPSIALTTKSYVIAHESGNPNNTSAKALDNELAFMKRNYNNAFVSHWVGGGGRIVQLAPVGKLQYGCGPKGNPHCYAQVELARTSDKEQFKKDYTAYVWLLRKLAKDAGMPITLDDTGKGIKSHKWITNNLGGTTHVDPYSYLASMGITEAQFKKDIKNGLDSEITTVSKPNNTEKYYKKGTGLYRIKKACSAYDGVVFGKSKKVQALKINEKYTIVDIVKVGYVYRLKTKSGLYITAKKEFVEKV